MSNLASQDPSAAVYRIDKFVVPSASLPAFIEKIREIQDIVRELPGCTRDLLLTQTGGPAEFNIVRLIEWSSAQAVESAVPKMTQTFKAMGFDPNAFFVQQLGARADMGFYQAL